MGFDDDLSNTTEHLKGRAKEAVGAATGDDDLKSEGQADQVKASLKDKVDNVKDKIKDKIDDVL